MTEKIIIRKYRSEDCRKLAELFYETVHSVNLRDYSQAQADAWAPEIPDTLQWDRKLSENNTFVAEVGNAVAGFGSIDKNGYLDMLFADKDKQGEGIGTALCDRLEEEARGMDIEVHASVTARPFFEKRGYSVVHKQEVIRNGVILHNFVMKKRAKDL